MDKIDVPPRITHEQFRAMLSCLGLAPYFEDMVAFHADLNGIHVELIAKNADGKPYMAGGSNNAATHSLAIEMVP